MRSPGTGAASRAWPRWPSTSRSRDAWSPCTPRSGPSGTSTPWSGATWRTSSRSSRPRQTLPAPRCTSGCERGRASWCKAASCAGLDQRGVSSPRGTSPSSQPLPPRLRVAPLTAAWTEIADAEPTRRNVREILARGQAGTNAARAILLDLLAVDLTRLTVGGATRQVAPKARTELRALLEDGSADVSEPFLSLADTESWSDLRGVVHRVAARLRAGGHAQAEAVLWALIRRADDSGLTEVKQAELVLDLGIPRSTISEHVKTLRRLFREELGRARGAPVSSLSDPQENCPCRTPTP
jgi:hypothetical protein